MIHESKSVATNPNGQIENQSTDKLIVLSNLLARAVTKWTLVQTKLFLLTLVNLEQNFDGQSINISKADVYQTIGMDNHQSYVREQFKKMCTNSFVSFTDNQGNWSDGFLFYHIRSTKSQFKISLNQEYKDLLLELNKDFTALYYRNISQFKTKSALKLYLYLCSWANNNYAENTRYILKNDLHKVFELEPSAYYRNYGTDDQKFDYATFERYCLNLAIDEINNNPNCDMHIICTKAKRGKFVLGYQFNYVFVHNNQIQLRLN